MTRPLASTAASVSHWPEAAGAKAVTLVAAWLGEQRRPRRQEKTVCSSPSNGRDADACAVLSGKTCGRIHQSIRWMHLPIRPVRGSDDVTFARYWSRKACGEQRLRTKDSEEGVLS